MKRYIILSIALLLLLSLSLSASGASEEREQTTTSYRRITAEEAKAMMDRLEDCIILDARSQAEYDSGHIPGAIVIPHTEINEKAPSLLKDKKQTILVYCRSGNRSKQASSALARLGYTNVYEFGGIISWPYDIVK